MSSPLHLHPFPCCCNLHLHPTSPLPSPPLSSPPQASCWWFLTFTASDIKSKVHHIQEIRQLYSFVQPRQLNLPQFVLDYDRKVCVCVCVCGVCVCGVCVCGVCVVCVCVCVCGVCVCVCCAFLYIVLGMLCDIVSLWCHWCQPIPSFSPPHRSATKLLVTLLPPHKLQLRNQMHFKPSTYMLVLTVHVALNVIWGIVSVAFIKYCFRILVRLPQ